MIGTGRFAAVTLVAWLLFLNLPPLFLFLVCLVYFAEITGVGFVFGFLLHPESIKKRILAIISFLVFGFLLGIALQNMT